MKNGTAYIMQFCSSKNKIHGRVLSKYINLPIKSDANLERVCLFRKETAVNDIKPIFFNAESKTLYNQHLLCSIYASFKKATPSNEDTIIILQTIKVSFFCKSTTFQYIFHYMGGVKKCKQNNKRAIFNHHEETFCQFTFKNAQIHNTEV